MFKLVVLCSVMALASAGAIAPLGLLGHGLGLGLAGHLGAPLGAHLGAPLVSPLAAAPVAWGAPVLGAYNYRGPLSLAPGQPANILAADGRPLDTLSVNLDRAAHYTARAVDGAHGLHLLKKRSAPLLGPLAGPIGPLGWSHAARIVAPGPVVGPVGLAGAPWGLAHGAPLGLGHAAPLALGHGHWW